MKPTHARHVGKVTKARFWESELSRLQRLVTLLVFPKDISNITVYFDRGEHNVLGIRVDSMTSSQLHGVMGGEVQSFPISGPNEGIVSIVVEDSPQRARSLVVRQHVHIYCRLDDTKSILVPNKLGPTIHIWNWRLTSSDQGHSKSLCK